MRRLGTLIAITMSLLLLGLALPDGDAVAQQQALKEQLIGSWTLVSWEQTYLDGSKRAPAVGSDPKGVLIFDSVAHFSLQIITNLPRFVSPSRLEGTPEENRLAVQGTISYFGTYSITETDRTLTLHVERSLFPNSNGTDQKRFFALNGNELKYSTQPVPSASGPFTSHLVWKRAQ